MNKNSEQLCKVCGSKLWSGPTYCSVCGSYQSIADEGYSIDESGNIVKSEIKRKPIKTEQKPWWDSDFWSVPYLEFPHFHDDNGCLNGLGCFLYIFLGGWRIEWIRGAWGFFLVWVPGVLLILTALGFWLYHNYL